MLWLAGDGLVLCVFLSVGLNGAAGGVVWDFVSGIYPPSSSPVASSAGVDLCRLRRELEEARGKIAQWEMAWQRAKQVRASAFMCVQAVPSWPGYWGTRPGAT